MMNLDDSGQYGPSYPALKRAIALAGTQEALARILGVTQPAVNKMLRSKAPLGAHHCVRIMAHLAISRQELRPTDFWDVWPDLPRPLSNASGEDTSSNPPFTG
ncbi:MULTISPECIES: YdaS family helix-turn-helix protein [Achromobacter]|jgi:DNA-binding transcriptional regulator YdaS (Cro superfamily)|uniref:transcriptional regulator n=2 Tax=Alcaligenaceae TaxID=506 RepID=UPI001266C78B